MNNPNKIIFQLLLVTLTFIAGCGGMEGTNEKENEVVYSTNDSPKPNEK